MWAFLWAGLYSNYVCRSTFKLRLTALGIGFRPVCTGGKIGSKVSLFSGIERLMTGVSSHCTGFSIVMWQACSQGGSRGSRGSVEPPELKSQISRNCTATAFREWRSCWESTSHCNEQKKGQFRVVLGSRKQ